MNKIHVLIQGYAHPGEDGSYIASPTTVLIESNGKKVLVDPGANKEELFGQLKRVKIKEKDIDFIYLSHYHPDHFLNIQYFPNTDIYDGEIKWIGDKEFFHKGDIGLEGVEILKTPGHSPEHTSLLVDTEEGKVCIAQDVFWWEDGKQKSDKVEDLLNLEDPFTTDMKALVESRKLVLEKSDWIIPGHGRRFRNPRKINYEDKKIN